MVGVSRGGMMTYMAAREDERIKKAAIISGISDLFMWYEERIDIYKGTADVVVPDMNTPEEEAEFILKALQYLPKAPGMNSSSALCTTPQAPHHCILLCPPSSTLPACSLLLGPDTPFCLRL